ncbi:MAG: DNA-directed RNA polymerase subunit beta', partial [Candidatus Melainabacteria bacterium]|nr:DNA-directed RNA polymerase subunit beta' [Candidatus Melainabacteria bacterium]
MVRKQKSKEKIEFINKVVNKKSLSKLVLSIYDQCGAATTAEVANALKQLGFHYATRAGVTLGIEDLVVPDDKKELLRHAEKEIDEAQKRYECGEITEVERYRKVIDTWSDTTQKLTDRVVENFDHLNPVYMMAFSGARGNISQVRQLVGMRGLMADS